MTLREIYETIDNERFMDVQHCFLDEYPAWQELERRIEFIEKLIEDGLNLEDEFVIKFIWDGGK